MNKNAQAAGYIFHCRKGLLKMAFDSGVNIYNPWCHIMINKNTQNDELGKIGNKDKETFLVNSESTSDVKKSVKRLCEFHSNHFYDWIQIDKMNFEIIIKIEKKSIHFLTVDESVMACSDNDFTTPRKIVQMFAKIDWQKVIESKMKTYLNYCPSISFFAFMF